jgi:hypothetical protein
MRTFLAALAACILMSPVALAAEGDFPYEAVVSADEADVYAGPGRRYYTTARLASGERVEVYRKEIGGWLAIRPPAGSFSWMPASQLKLVTEPDVAEVVEDGVQSWIGSRVTNVHEHKSQVALDRGEVVQILGEKTVDNEEGGKETWYKIAPPTGEFRYIHIRDVSRVLAQGERPPAPPRRAAAEEEEGPPLTSARGEPEPFAAEDSQPRYPRVRPRESKPLAKQRANITLVDIFRPGTEEELRQLPMVGQEVVPAAGQSAVRSSPSAAKPKGPAGDGFQPRKARRTDVVATPVDRTTRARESTTRIASLPTTTVAASRPLPKNEPPPVGNVASESKPITRPHETEKTSTAAMPIEPAEFRRRLEEVELELSAMVANHPSTWRLADLRQRVQVLVEDGPTGADRGEARLLLEHIHKFAESFGVEDDPVRSLLPGAPVANTAVKPLPEQNKTTAIAAASDPKYDGEGWLKPVLSREKPAAPYAIVDDQGNPVAFVTPSPGLNLNRYLNKKVGVYGQRGVIEALNSPHIVASRVIDLERHLR